MGNFFTTDKTTDETLQDILKNQIKILKNEDVNNIKPVNYNSDTDSSLNLNNINNDRNLKTETQESNEEDTAQLVQRAMDAVHTGGSRNHYNKRIRGGCSCGRINKQEFINKKIDINDY